MIGSAQYQEEEIPPDADLPAIGSHPIQECTNCCSRNEKESNTYNLNERVTHHLRRFIGGP
ncbi:hypothetical protein SynBIOSE41_03698 [Synechococcus sp. BIOS-E4-1]|nr:hypothetical protein SynBIOSE41_03698 [Synechococcus sp. BIOS-E4-1]